MLFTMYRTTFNKADELLEYLKYHDEEELENYSDTELSDIKMTVEGARESVFGWAAGFGLLGFVMFMVVMAGAAEMILFTLVFLVLSYGICMRYIWPLDDEISKLTTVIQKKRSDSV